MKWEGLKVFISGVDGFVGSHLAKALLERGAFVSGIIHKPVKKSTSGLLVWKLTKKVQTQIGDIADSNFVAYILRDFEPQWIFHLAAQSIVTEAQINPFVTCETNVKGTYNLLYSASKLNGLQGVVLASSDKAYGASPILPYQESMPLRGGSIYDTSKACADLIAMSYSQGIGLPVCITRCSNIYGPGDLHFSRIVPDAMKAVINGNRPIIRGNGLHERDFVYIDDVVVGYLKIANYLRIKQVKGEAFNLGTGKSTRVIDLVQMIIDASNNAVEGIVIKDENNPVEIMKQHVDYSKAKKYLGWSPDILLPVGIKLTLQWYQNYFAQRTPNESNQS